MSINNTKILLERPIILFANLDENDYAEGTLLLDKGISRSEI